ncbi:hypothetical protein ABID23_000919 [Bartonella silvatica]|uniref:Uncharacterized protein n=1 Tax=Bartonella silvatica TaxID=357760 RepID=A0ABV2HHG0_9HYPH
MSGLKIFLIALLNVFITDEHFNGLIYSPVKRLLFPSLANQHPTPT